jgi:Flp pilus assembly protein TadG
VQTQPTEDAGTVTAETAVLLPALVVLLVLSLWSINAVGAQLRCIDAARTSARAMARGETTAAAAAAGRTLAPRGAAVNITQDGALVIVAVGVHTRLPGPWGRHGPSIHTGCKAAAAVEH